MRHPPFRPHASTRIADPCSAEGAHRLARQIERAWHEAGHVVTAHVQPAHPQSDIHVVRMPDLVNGLPRRRGAA